MLCNTTLLSLCCITVLSSNLHSMLHNMKYTRLCTLKEAEARPAWLVQQRSRKWQHVYELKLLNIWCCRRGHAGFSKLGSGWCKAKQQCRACVADIHNLSHKRAAETAETQHYDIVCTVLSYPRRISYTHPKWYLIRYLSPSYHISYTIS